MSVKRRDLIKYFEENGFYLLREGGNHSIYTNGEKTIPIKRHRTIAVLASVRHSLTFAD
ncbi:MAG: type II toxin-antitoxin system HicA family toxin [Microcystis aeruginosa W13-18]|nr:type II toxin-antitoxin system HicA family toxin [Microcystis aeruginosa W13-18]NCR36817.1 type II toxin-antitoxin system HicA family toxin [Microcystis aeruginosa S11-05]NCR50323.1 type II toxin-antitoxin system HicA family toxin [Microcystis aeruginosa S11-01]